MKPRKEKSPTEEAFERGVGTPFSSSYDRELSDEREQRQETERRHQQREKDDYTGMLHRDY